MKVLLHGCLTSEMVDHHVLIGKNAMTGLLGFISDQELVFLAQEDDSLLLKIGLCLDFSLWGLHFGDCRGYLQGGAM